MDRAEYRDTIRKIKDLETQERYSEAANIIGSVNWKKVKSASTLCNMGMIMSKAGRYKEGKDLLLMAYDHATVGRSIVYELVEVALQEGNLEEAQEYYEEYAEIAPKDSKRYLLQYKIAKARKRPDKELIPILEKLNDKEFSEEWSYELALLYHKTGEKEKCIQMCDDIDLYFGNGAYVEKALELKQIHTVLTREQTKKQEAFRTRKGGTAEIPGTANSQREDASAENSAKYSTINLQAELAKGMQQIMDAPDSQTVQSTMRSIQKLVKDSQLPIEELTEEKDEELFRDIETEKEIDDALNLNFHEILKEEEPEQSEQAEEPEQKADGQMSIEEILAEWEKTKTAAKEALDEAESRRLESARQRALVQTENLMEQLQDLSQRLQDMPAEMSDEALAAVASESIDTDLVAEAVQEEQPMDATRRISAEEIKEALAADQMPETEEASAEESFPEAEEDEVEELGEPEELSELETLYEQPVAEEDYVEETYPEEEEAEAEEEYPEEEPQEEPLPEIQMPKEVKLTEDIEEETAVTRLTEEQKEQFSYFMSVAGMENQICSILEGVRNRKKDLTSNSGNIMITGEKHCGKTQLAADLVKVIQKDYPHESGQVGRIKAESLNHKSVRKIIEKVYGGYLIIESAGDLSEQKANELAGEMTRETGGLLVIIEDTSRRLKELLLRSGALAGKFTEKIRIPLFTNDELVEFGKLYAYENGYVIDEMAVLSLYECIASIAKANQATTLEEVKEIVEDAMDNAKHGRLFSKKDEDGNIILREKDFDY